MKILLGGVPFGRNNIGDEAILECVVRIVREAAPGCDITVSTDDPSTAGRLGVKVCPLFGFDVVPYSPADLAKAMSSQDLYIWSGATGLSDYPDRACELLGAARVAGRPRIVWNVGMNSELNPAKYRLQGGRLAVARRADSFTLGLLGVRARWEEAMERGARKALATELAGCRLVVTRDPESAAEVVRCGLPLDRVVVGADSALIQSASPWPPAALDAGTAARLSVDGVRRVGLCISAQRKITRMPELVGAIDRLLEEPGLEVVGLPMNPITDLALLEELRSLVAQPGRFVVVRGLTEPADITALAARMDVLISSRLHLLILGSIHHIPIIGISRGSKVDNFLAPYGLKAAGSVESCDFDVLVGETRRLIGDRAGFEMTSRAVRANLLQRLDDARSALAAAIRGGAS